MEELIIRVKNKRKVPFLKELLNHMNFVEIVETSKKENKDKVLNELDEAVKQVNLHKKGKGKLKPFQQLLDEL